MQAPAPPPVPNSVAASALSSGGDGPPQPLPDSGPPGPHAGAAPDSFATGATLPEGLLAGLEALRAAQRGSGVGGAGLSTQALLDILDSDPRFRAERSMISALLNQPKKVRGRLPAAAAPACTQQLQHPRVAGAGTLARAACAPPALPRKRGCRAFRAHAHRPQRAGLPDGAASCRGALASHDATLPLSPCCALPMRPGRKP